MAPLLLAHGLNHSYNPSSQVRNSNFQFCILKIHLEEVLLEFRRVRRIKSGSVVKIKRENKKD
jgi:hypothetical protein